MAERIEEIVGKTSPQTIAAWWGRKKEMGKALRQAKECSRLALDSFHGFYRENEKFLNRLVKDYEEGRITGPEWSEVERHTFRKELVFREKFFKALWGCGCRLK